MRQPKPHEQVVKGRPATRIVRQAAGLVRLGEPIPQPIILAPVKGQVGVAQLRSFGRFEVGRGRPDLLCEGREWDG
jgi:hypothetical protein